MDALSAVRSIPSVDAIGRRSEGADPREAPRPNAPGKETQ